MCLQLFNILVVHDDPATLASIRRLLEANGMIVDEAGSYAAIDAKAKSGRHDAVLCEMRMLTMDGMEVQAVLKNSSPSYLRKLLFASINLPTESGMAIISHQNMSYLMEPAEVVVKLRSIAGQKVNAEAGGVERRKHRRIAIKGKVRVLRKQFSAGPPDLASLINVSRHGLLFATRNPYWIGAEVLVAYPHSDPNCLEQEGVVVRVDECKDGSRQVAVKLTVA